MTDAWASDVPISMPEPPPTRPLVPLDGMAFTIDGICHPLTEEEAAEISTPTYAPKEPT